MENVNEILPGVIGAGGTGAAMIVMLKVFLNHWLRKADKSEELAQKHDRAIAVLETKMDTVQKDLDGLGGAMRRELAALQK